MRYEGKLARKNIKAGYLSSQDYVSMYACTPQQMGSEKNALSNNPAIGKDQGQKSHVKRRSHDDVRQYHSQEMMLIKLAIPFRCLPIFFYIN